MISSYPLGRSPFSPPTIQIAPITILHSLRSILNSRMTIELRSLPILLSVRNILNVPLTLTMSKATTRPSRLNMLN
ncbi:MAG: hypothetical protein NT070_15765 [Cyanobacteria bacterium]|nr:hypothetical protein [Cyanobacteriota bacterium]